MVKLPFWICQNHGSIPFHTVWHHIVKALAGSGTADHCNIVVQAGLAGIYTHADVLGEDLVFGSIHIFQFFIHLLWIRKFSGSVFKPRDQAAIVSDIPDDPEPPYKKQDQSCFQSQQRKLWRPWMCQAV